MKAAGIVRSIDELGRVVIPKEIRQQLRIVEGTPMEIYISRQQEIVLRKYSPLQEVRKMIVSYVDVLRASTRYEDIHVVDYDGNAVDSARSSFPIHDNVPDAVARSMEERRAYVIDKQQSFWSFSSAAIAPIVVHGDPVGAVLLGDKEVSTLGDFELKLVETAAYFIGKFLES